MSVLTEAEIEYLTSRRIGRLATVGADGQPHVVPLRFRYNPDLDVLELGGRDIGKSKKYRDAALNPRVALVVDDMSEAGKPRGIEIRGRAEVFATGGEGIMRGFDPEFIRLTPTRIASWGIDTDPFHPRGRQVG